MASLRPLMRNTILSSLCFVNLLWKTPCSFRRWRSYFLVSSCSNSTWQKLNLPSVQQGKFFRCVFTCSILVVQDCVGINNKVWTWQQRWSSLNVVICANFGGVSHALFLKCNKFTSGRAMVPRQRRQKTASSGGSPRCSSSTTVAILTIWNVKFFKLCQCRPWLRRVLFPFISVCCCSHPCISVNSYISK